MNKRTTVAVEAFARTKAAWEAARDQETAVRDMLAAAEHFTFKKHEEWDAAWSELHKAIAEDETL